MELERELDDLNERLEEQGGATQAQVKKWLYGGSLRGKKNEGEGGGFPFSPLPSLSSIFFCSRSNLRAIT